MKRFSLFILLLALCFGMAQAAKPKKKRAAGKVRVACVGNSVTFGYGLPDRATQAYPMRLQQMLGEGYDVRNFGHSGATLLRKGHRPYMKLPEFKAAVDYKADLVVIHLGLNDTDPRNWPNYSEEFIPDYTALIDSFRVANPKAKIWICRMTPIFHDHPRFDSGTLEWHGQIQKAIDRIGTTNPDVEGIIDLYEPLHKFPNLFPDALHPDTAGALILAETVYGKLTGNYGGLRLPATYTDHMVLQRDRPVNIAGRANAGEKVTVEFAGERRVAVADSDGRWSVAFGPKKAGGPYRLSASAKSGAISLVDVWTGEVWLCSGQSNMEMRLREIATAKADIAEAAKEERVHLYNMPSIAPTYAFEWTPERLDSVNRLLYVLPGKWKRCSEGNAANFSAIAYHFGKMLADSLGCHVGLISNAVGGSGCESWVGRSHLERLFPALLRNWKNNDFIQPWVRGRAAHNTKQAKSPRQRHPYEPAYLFDNAILPLKGTELAGVIWYQGESNAHNVEGHARTFSCLVESWNDFFVPRGTNRRLPFHFVQLSSLSTRPSWPAFRNSQRALADSLRQKEVYMSVSSDLGDSLNVHPTRKAEVGRRLALQALRHTYKRSHLVSEGPSCAGIIPEGTELVVRFKHGTAQGMRPATGNRLAGFEIAGKDGLYHPARAVVDGTSVRLSAPGVPRPVAVRYGWQPFTRANLVNAAGLPASTFCSGM